MAKNPYEVLGVSRTATDDEIQKAYRRLARQHHPDRNPGDKQAETTFKEVQAAYDVLGDKSKRAEFDQFGFAGGPGPAGGPNVHFRDGGQEFDPGMAERIFRQFFGGAGDAFGSGPRQSRRARPRPAYETEVAVPLETAVAGGTLDIRIDGQSVSVKIPAGIEDGKVLRLAGQAAGGGDLLLRVRVQPHERYRFDDGQLTLAVPVSVGEAVLGGSVEVPLPDGGTATVKIPPGSSGGTRLRLRGKGVSGGDLFLVLQVATPANVSERGKELIREFATLHPDNPRDGRW